MHVVAGDEPQCGGRPGPGLQTCNLHSWSVLVCMPLQAFVESMSETETCWIKGRYVRVDKFSEFQLP